MGEFGEIYPLEPSASPRLRGRTLILIFCSGLVLGVVLCCCAAVVVVAGMLHQFGTALDRLFSSLLAGIPALFSAAIGYLLLLAYELIELLGLLSAGQVIPFFMRLGKLLSSS